MSEINENNGKKKSNTGLIIGIIAAVIVVFFVIPYKMMYPKEYRIFTEKRIEEVEDLYKISLENTKPVHFCQVLLGHEYDLYLYTDDHKKLMDTFTGYSMEFLYEEPGGSFVQYKGSADGEHDILVRFDKVDNKKGKYKGVLQYIIETHR